MAFTFAFTPKSFNAAQYKDIIKQLEQAGAGAPPGRLYHVCYGSGNQLRVLDVWESKEAFQRFGETLMPIAKKVGFDPGEPTINEIHGIIKG
ncbi:MAG: hypothetical protein WBW16_11630 [Bacteroidota bacterium]